MCRVFVRLIHLERRNWTGFQRCVVQGPSWTQNGASCEEYVKWMLSFRTCAPPTLRIAQALVVSWGDSTKIVLSRITKEIWIE